MKTHFFEPANNGLKFPFDSNELTEPPRSGLGAGGIPGLYSHLFFLYSLSRGGSTGGGGGEGPGGQDPPFSGSGSPLLGGPPNFIKRGKKRRVRACEKKAAF